MLDIVNRNLNSEFVHHSTWHTIDGLVEPVKEYSKTDEIIDSIDFRSMLYVTKPEDIQYFYDMVINMTTYEFKEARKRDITNKKLIIYCSENKNAYWRETYKDLEEQIEIFNNFNILSMTLLEYLNGEIQYTVILDGDISDEIAFQGIICMRAFLQLPLLTYGKMSYHFWCSCENVAMVVSMFNDITPTKLIFKNCYQEKSIQDIFGEDKALQQPSDFTLFSGDVSSEWTNKNTLQESYFASRKPLSE